jgi:hypothetical protein
MATTIKKENSRTFATISINKEGQVLAMVEQDLGASGNAYLASKTFKTEAGARRWVSKQFSI